MKMNASVQYAHFPVCVGTQLEVTLVTVPRDMLTKAEKIQRAVKVGLILNTDQSLISH